MRFTIFPSNSGDKFTSSSYIILTPWSQGKTCISVLVIYVHKEVHNNNIIYILIRWVKRMSFAPVTGIAFLCYYNDRYTWTPTHFGRFGHWKLIVKLNMVSTKVHPNDTDLL